MNPRRAPHSPRVLTDCSANSITLSWCCASIYSPIYKEGCFWASNAVEPSYGSGCFCVYIFVKVIEEHILFHRSSTQTELEARSNKRTYFYEIEISAFHCSSLQTPFESMSRLAQAFRLSRFQRSKALSLCLVRKLRFIRFGVTSSPICPADGQSSSLASPIRTP